VAPGSTMELIDTREGANGWHTFRLDTFSIRVHNNSFVIEGDVSQLD
jgi:hypothetical protein